MSKALAEQAKLEAETALLKAKTALTKLEIAQYTRDEAAVAASEYENRIYTFDSAVGEKTVADCIGALGLWVRQDAKKKRPIKVIFNSPGGDVFDGLALYDFIQSIRAQGTRVDTGAIGMAASMGGVLLQAGERRTMSPNSFMLIHEVSAGARGNMSELKDKVKFINQLQDRCLSILAERSKYSKQQIKNRWERKDWWFPAEQALELGFCDEIS